MSVNADQADKSTRGRIVMLVDNGVRNDSRVQKQARSAAEMGWDVYLIGKSPTQRPERFRIGDAKVRLVPVQGRLHKRRYEMRGGPLRGSLGYSSRRLALHREATAEARLYDARMSRMRSRLAAQQEQAPTARVREALTGVRLAAALAESTWVEKRLEATERDFDNESRLDSPWGSKVTDLVTRLYGDRAWRKLDPHRWDFDLAYKDLIDRLAPDIIHANDFGMIGVGANAAVRARAAGRRVKLVYDAHEFVPGISRSSHPWWLPAQIAYEREFIHEADAVVTVSEVLADMLQETHDLPERPAVVMNAPQVGESAMDADAPRMRELCGIDEKTPLVIYSGGVAPQRGVQIMVEAMPRLPEVHVAFITASPEKRFVQELVARARELGAEDRLHLLPYVAPEHVVEYVSAADIGVHPTHHHLNHEISLATKFFEYSHARLPIVVSDVKTMGDMVRASGQGEVFRAEDLDDYVRAITAVLADPERYRAAYDKPGLLEEWTWRKQAEVLDSVYERLIRK